MWFKSQDLPFNEENMGLSIWWYTKAESAWDIPYLNRKIFLFRYQIFESDFFVINLSYLIIRFLLLK